MERHKEIRGNFRHDGKTMVAAFAEPIDGRDIDAAARRRAVQDNKDFLEALRLQGYVPGLMERGYPVRALTMQAAE